MSIFNFNKNHNVIIINSTNSILDSIRLQECKKLFTYSEYNINDISKAKVNFFEDRLYLCENSNLSDLNTVINALQGSNTFLIIFTLIDNSQNINKDLVSYHGNITLNKDSFKDYVDLIITQLKLDSIENFEEIYSTYKKYFKSEYLEKALTYLPTIIVNSKYKSNIPLLVKEYETTLKLGKLFYDFLLSRKKNNEYYELYNCLLAIENEDLLDSMHRVIDIFIKTKYFKVSQEKYFDRQIIQFDSVSSLTLLKTIMEFNNHYKEIIECPLIGLQNYLNSLIYDRQL